MLNDGSKHINVVEWKKQSNLSQRVEISRRRSRRCSLISLALAKTPEQQVITGPFFEVQNYFFNAILMRTYLFICLKG